MTLEYREELIPAQVLRLQASSPPVTICRQRVTNLNRLSDPRECVLTNGSKLTLPPLVAAHIARADELSFALPNSSVATAEILVTKNSLAGSSRDVYQVPIGYVTQPKKDKRWSTLATRPKAFSRQRLSVAEESESVWW